MRWSDGALGRTARRVWNLTRGPFKTRVGVTPAEVVWTENKWKLLRYRPATVTHGAPVLLVPSLINRHYVLDLAPGRSVVEYLLGQGHAVYIIDWGKPGPEDRFLTLEDIVAGYIGRAVRKVAKEAPEGRVHLLGYCLGGTLAAIYAAYRPAQVASLTALAAPIAFGESGMLGAWTRSEGFDVEALVRATGNVPWPLMQAAFHMLRPTLGLSKLVHLVDRGHDDEMVQGFFALERWGNDNVSFPGTAYAEYIRQLYIDDALVQGGFRLGGEPVRLSSITCPTHVISFAHDIIVPSKSATALLGRIGSEHKQHTELGGGHVGAVVSRKACERLWPALSGFFRAHDAAAPTAPKPSRRRRPGAERTSAS